METDRVNIWPRMEPFLLGALQVDPLLLLTDILEI